MTLIKKINKGKATIEIYSSDLSLEEQKNNLIKLYKTINNIANNQMLKGNDVSNWFYTKSNLENMKKAGNYNFLK